MARRRFLPALAAVIVTAGCGAAQAPSTAERPGAGPAGMYSVGSTVFGLGRDSLRLESPPVAPLAGWLAPAGVPSPDGRYLAYNTWHEVRRDDPRLSWSDQGIEPGDRLATPSIRLYDGATERDDLLEAGAFSIAWRADGAVAYFKGVERDYRAAVPYEGHVVVRSNLEADPKAWSSKRARYIVVAWAGETLVAYRESEGEVLDVVAFDGPGRMRVLARGAAVVALSPDGTRVFVERGPAHGRPSVRVLEVADGSTIAALDLTTIDPSVGAVSYSGDWLGRRVVAPSASGLAVFEVGGGTIRLERSFAVAGAQGIAEPRFSDFAGRRVTAWTTAARGGVLLDCDLAAVTCRRFVPLPLARGSGGFPAWRRPLYNPSRPQ